jgi:uncharacterized protein YqeY
MGGTDGDLVADRLRAALKDALRARDAVAVAAVRSALASLDNAGAVDPAAGPRTGAGEHVAGGVAGLGAGEVARREVGEDERREIVAGEVAERRSAAAGYRDHGHGDRAARLDAEADVLERILRPA